MSWECASEMKIKFIFNIFMQTLKVCQDCPSFKIYGWRNSFNNILFLQHSFPSSLVARDSQFPLGLCSSADINNQNLLYLVWGIWTTLMKTNHEEKITLCWQTILFIWDMASLQHFFCLDEDSPSLILSWFLENGISSPISWGYAQW